MSSLNVIESKRFSLRNSCVPPARITISLPALMTTAMRSAEPEARPTRRISFLTAGDPVEALAFALVGQLEMAEALGGRIERNESV